MGRAFLGVEQILNLRKELCLPNPLPKPSPFPPEHRNTEQNRVFLIKIKRVACSSRNYIAEQIRLFWNTVSPAKQSKRVEFISEKIK